MAVAMAIVMWGAFANWPRISTWSSGLATSNPVGHQGVPDTAERIAPSTRLSPGEWDSARALLIVGQVGSEVTLDAPFQERAQDYRFLVTVTKNGECQDCVQKVAAYCFKKNSDGWTLQGSNTALVERSAMHISTELVMLGPSRHGLEVRMNGKDFSETLFAAPLHKDIKALWSGYSSQCSGPDDCKEAFIELVSGPNTDNNNYYDVRVSPFGGWAAASFFSFKEPAGIYGKVKRYGSVENSATTEEDAGVLSSAQEKVVEYWLQNHKQYRLALDADCDCADAIQSSRNGYGGLSKPVPGYHPYVAIGDFNGDGRTDFAVAVVDGSKQNQNFTLLVFNGPIETPNLMPAFVESNLDLRHSGLFYGQTGTMKPYRLTVGPFESDTAGVLVQRGQTYRYE